MRSVSSSEVICNISIRWRNCGVSTSRCERLVVKLRDIPQIRSLIYFFFWIIAASAARQDYNRSAALSCAISVHSLKIRQRILRKTQRLHRDLNNSSHTKLFAEVKATHFRIFREVPRLARTKNLPFRHDVSAVGDAQSLAHVVVGDQDTDTTISQVEYYILNIIDRFWIDTRKRLVEQDVVGLGCERSGYFGAPPLAA